MRTVGGRPTPALPGGAVYTADTAAVEWLTDFSILRYATPSGSRFHGAHHQMLTLVLDWPAGREPRKLGRAPDGRHYVQPVCALGWTGW